jgi:mannose-1-phosphate guanylyltransferase/mannose-6-phosphate isomerase
MLNHNYAILLAGGQGSRFWPLSRTLEPKQFLAFNENETLFEQTLERIKPLIPPQNIFVATSHLYKYQISQLLLSRNIPLENIIFETESRNTAPCIGAAVKLISLKDSLARVCILPCDHMIKNRARFLALLKKAFDYARENLVILGIPPERAATGYGYIKIAKKTDSRGLFGVERFLEKPDLTKAKVFLKDKRYFWNAGIFIASCRVFLEEYRKNLASLYSQIAKIESSEKINWKKMPSISFDYGILEKAKNVLMLKADNLGWSDLGSWQAWDQMLKKDRNGNSLIGDVINLGSSNTTILAKSRLVASIGLNDLIVIDSPDAILITKKDKSEEVKKIVENLRSNSRQEYYYHRTVKRPWGSYTVLDTGRGFKVKLVEVAPHKSLSLQMHRKRSEHWVVVEGKARIVRGKKCTNLNSNESTFIPLACVHRLINPGDSILRIVEVQAGHFLEESDIVRLKDDFGRGK